MVTPSSRSQAAVRRYPAATPGASASVPHDPASGHDRRPGATAAGCSGARRPAGHRTPTPRDPQRGSRSDAGRLAGTPASDRTGRHGESCRQTRRHERPRARHRALRTLPAFPRSRGGPPTLGAQLLLTQPLVRVPAPGDRSRSVALRERHQSEWLGEEDRAVVASGRTVAFVHVLCRSVASSTRSAGRAGVCASPTAWRSKRPAEGPSPGRVALQASRGRGLFPGCAGRAAPSAVIWPSQTTRGTWAEVGPLKQPRDPGAPVRSALGGALQSEEQHCAVGRRARRLRAAGVRQAVPYDAPLRDFNSDGSIGTSRRQAKGWSAGRVAVPVDDRPAELDESAPFRRGAASSAGTRWVVPERDRP